MSILEIIREPFQPWLRKLWHKIIKFFKSTFGTVIITRSLQHFSPINFKLWAIKVALKIIRKKFRLL